jgi:23S rRNA pseudouridine1911/1915/1917 synthase
MSEDEAGEDDVLLFEAGPEDAGVRLDGWLAAKCADLNLSRSRLKALILEGAVSVNDSMCGDPSKKVQPGMAIEIAVPPPEDATPVPENIPLDIVYEDDDLLVLNKQAGLVVHPAPGHSRGTLVNALLYHCGNSLSGIGGVRRPGIVHRLDKDTSGLMIVAKNDAAHQGLSAQLADRSLSRHYHAVVWHAPTLRKGKVDEPVGRHPASRQKMAVNRRNGRPAVTHYTLLEAYGGGTAALLECRLETGRTHQVRVHMAYAGHPLVGDPVYGAQATAASSLLKKGGYSDAAKQTILQFPRQALHACKIHFIHPVTDEGMAFEASLPGDLQTLLKHFKSIS